MIRTVNSPGQHQDRQQSRFHTPGESADDIGRMSGGGLFYNGVYRPLVHRRIVFGNDAHERAHQSSKGDGAIHVHVGKVISTDAHRFGKHPPYYEKRNHRGQQNGRPIPFIQCSLNAVRLFSDTDKPDTDDRKYKPKACDQHGKQNRGDTAEVVGRYDLTSQHHGGQNGGHVRTEQISAHSGKVSHIVSHVVGNGGRVTHIVFGDPCFHFSDQVGAYVGCFGIDTAAHTCKQRNAFRTQGESCEHFQRLFHLNPVHVATLLDHEHIIEYDKQRPKTQYSQSCNPQTHHRAAG